MTPVYRFTFFYIFVIPMHVLSLPDEVTKDVYCVACDAVVKEIFKRVTKKSVESAEMRVIDAMDDICNQDNYRSYDYIPPKMAKACRHLIGKYDEEIEEEFIKTLIHSEKPDAVLLQGNICMLITKACDGIDMKTRKPEKDNKARFHIDGVTKEVDFGPGNDDIVKQARPVKEDL